MHGELDIVYGMLCTLEEAEGIKIDLLLCYGDFQVRAPCSPSILTCGAILRSSTFA